MFVQVISGSVGDAAALREEWSRWDRDLRPGAIGFSGATAGVSDEGRFVALARFESAEAAAANSARPEQGEWWAAVAKTLSGEASFADSDDVETLMGGGSDDAGFVQIIEADDADRAALQAFDELFERHAASWRPEIVGALRVWTGPTSYVEAAYFTSEAAARAGEGSEPPAELAPRMGEFREAMSTARFTDLSDPILS